MNIKNNRFVRGIYFLYRKVFGVARSRYGYLSKNQTFTAPFWVDNPKNLYVYSDTTLVDCYISTTNAKFVVKENCVIAEGLTVHTGNHVRICGKFVNEINESNKPKGYDADVIVEEDVWIGCRVTLLSGVTIGRGATIAAGAVVNKAMPPYCICGGVPARFIKFYWDIDQILEHEAKLYTDDKRYTREQLKAIFSEYE